MNADDRRHDRFTDVIQKQSARARRRETTSWWHGLGLFGVVGWMIVTPTLIGVAMGRLIDSHFNTGISCTLTLLLLGVVLGCGTAWRTIKESLR